jgi:dTDP-4-amino-4,6-dideoxygalactose transaminase
MHLYIVRVRAEERDPLIAHLADHGIAAMIHYPVPVHLSKAYSFLGLPEGSYPQAESMAREIVTLPMYAELTDEQARKVVEALSSFYRGDQRSEIRYQDD